MIQQIITFDGGLSTKKRPHLIQRNEGIICENVDIESGGLCPLPNFIYIDNIDGKHIYPQGGGIVYNTDSTDDRFYETYSGRLYWSNAEYSTFGIKRYDGTNAGEDAEAPDAPDVIPSATIVTAGQLNGAYVYCYTFFDDTGVESAPSPFLDVSPVDNEVVLTFADTNEPLDLAQRRVYRTGGDNPTFNLIGEIDVGTLTYTDNTRDLDVSRIELYTFEDTPPVDDLDMLVECNGTMWGSYGNNVYFSRTGSPEYWGVLDYIRLDKECTGLGKFGDSVIAFTRTSAYMINGANRDTINVQRLPFNQGCISSHSVVNIDAYLLWTSLNGICIFNGSTIDVITKKILSWDEFGRVGDLRYEDFDDSTDRWDSALGFDIAYAEGYRDRYYGVFSNGILSIDLSDGVKITTIKLTGVVSLAINYDDNLLYAVAPNEVSGYDVYYLPSGCDDSMDATWKTGRLADNSTNVVKHYRDVELDAMPISVEVFIEGVSIRKYIGKKQFKLPASAFGRDIQFEIITNNGIRSLKYEYSEMKI